MLVLQLTWLKLASHSLPWLKKGEAIAFTTVFFFWIKINILSLHNICVKDYFSINLSIIFVWRVEQLKWSHYICVFVCPTVFVFAYLYLCLTVFIFVYLYSLCVLCRASTLNWPQLSAQRLQQSLCGATLQLGRKWNNFWTSQLLMQIKQIKIELFAGWLSDSHICLSKGVTVFSHFQCF